MDRGTLRPWGHKKLDKTEQITLSQDRNTIRGRGTLRKQMEYKDDMIMM